MKIIGSNMTGTSFQIHVSKKELKIIKKALKKNKNKEKL